MNFDVQTIITMLLVGSAVAYLALRCYKALTRASRGGCGTGCHGCNSGQMVDLDLPKPDR